MISKKLLVLFTFCVLAAPLHADQEEIYQSCMQSVLKAEKAPPPEAKAILEMTCRCGAEQITILRQTQNSKIDGGAVLKSCYFSAFVRHATDDLEYNTTDADMMTACKSMFNFNNEKVEDADLKMLDTFCQCAQPKLSDLFKQSDSMSDKQYNDAVYSLAAQCSVNLNLKR